LVERFVDLMRLERDEHVVLHAQLACVGGGAHGHRERLARGRDAQPVAADGVERRAPCDDTHVAASGAREMRRQIAADRPASENAYPRHSALSCESDEWRRASLRREASADACDEHKIRASPARGEILKNDDSSRSAYSCESRQSR